jgi:hypothetical protein
MRDATTIREAMTNVARQFQVAKAMRDKAEDDMDQAMLLIRRIDTAKADAERRMEMYHCQYDSLQDELDRVYEAQAEAMMTP